MANKNPNKRKLGKLTEKQKHFIKLFVNGYPLEHILTDLEIEEWEIVSYMSHNPVFLSALNSALFLKEQSLYINNLVVRIKALELLEKFIEAGDLEAVKMALSNSEHFPEFNKNDFSPQQINKSNMNSLFKYLESNLGIPPRRRPGKWGDFFDDEPPF